MNAESSNESSATRFLLTRLSLFETIIDLLTGILMILLLGPLLLGIRDSFVQSPGRESLISIYIDFLKIIGSLSLGTAAPYLVAVVACMLGVISRVVFTAYTLFQPKCVDTKVIVPVAFWLVKRWHGVSGSWDIKRILQEFVDRTPLHTIGTRDFAEFRIKMDNPETILREFKGPWEYEFFLYARSQHIYGIILTFFYMYLIYGSLIIIKGFIMSHSTLTFPEIVAWVVALCCTFIAAILSFQEIIIHGIAFVEVDQLAHERLRETKGGKK